MHHPTDRITHTTAFVTPVVEHWLERDIAQWVHYLNKRRLYIGKLGQPVSRSHEQFVCGKSLNLTTFLTCHILLVVCAEIYVEEGGGEGLWRIPFF